MTGHWVEFPVRYSRFSLVIYGFSLFKVGKFSWQLFWLSLLFLVHRDISESPKNRMKKTFLYTWRLKTVSFIKLTYVLILFTFLPEVSFCALGDPAPLPRSSRGDVVGKGMALGRTLHPGDSGGLCIPSGLQQPAWPSSLLCASVSPELSMFTEGSCLHV